MAKQVICVDCGHTVADGKPRVVVNGYYVCGDCLYYRETGKHNPKLLERRKIG